MSSFVCVVSQCRFCGCILPFEEGARRHGTICRFAEKLRGQNYQLMINVNFPCPRVCIRKLYFSPIQTKKLKRLTNSSSQNVATETNNNSSFSSKSPRRQSSLRALEKLREANSLNFDRDKIDYENNEETDFQETESESDSESDGEDIAPKLKRRKVRIKSSYDAQSSSNGNDNESLAPGTFINSQGKYLCPYKGCGRKFHALWKLKQHFLVHLEKTPYQCPIKGCNTKLRGRCFYIKHMEWHQGKNLVPCEKCGRYLHSMEKLKDHSCNKGSNRKYKGSYFDANGYLRCQSGSMKITKPMTEHEIDEKVEEIKIVPKRATNQLIASDPVFHQVCKENPGFKEFLLGQKKKGKKSKQDSSEKYKCLKCDRTYGKRQLLLNHVNRSHISHPFKCKTCGKGFLKKSFCRSHEAQHRINDVYSRKNKNGIWSCTKCGFESNFEGSVRRHWQLIHKVDIPSRNEKKKSSENGTGARSKRKNVSCLTNEEFVEKVEPKSTTGSSNTEIKIKSEPSLELTMIKPEAVAFDLNCKQEDSAWE